ncbi:rho GTPase-activating protein 26-like isoform X2 [Daphnia pulicaria]|uniref:rho GTPase-activating protein 26-like isoform X2 n=1 Tax=Daphnia pulicaria TaxID=35523 RepID=UPI001EECD7DC|nr:rho GTPase-activating protein 26-like isoform X2 [Daphnia pulicaria]
MGLLPLEFTECLTDSPYFRENLQGHEKELEKTSLAIKVLIKEVKDLVNAARALSRAQRSLATSLMSFQFECIGNSQTDDEIVIAGSLKEFGRLINAIEDERDRMLERAKDQFIGPLENFRKEHIGGAKEEKKKFEKQTAKFVQSQERHLNLSTKKQDSVLQEADAILEMEQRHFCQASLEYVYRLQEVHERKKFEFVETLLGFMYGWLTFYHQGYEVSKEFRPYMTDLQVRLQKTRENFNTTREEAESLMRKMLEVRKTKPCDPGSLNKMYTRQGYLYVMEKKAFGTTWSKHYCQYTKENRIFTMIPYTQTIGKITTTDTMEIKSCTRRMSESIEKRFCFDITPKDRLVMVITLQALSEDDRRLWLDAMDGKEPVTHQPTARNPFPTTYAQPGKSSKHEETTLDEVGFLFIRTCIKEIENRGLEDQGLYRLVGVSSKVSKLLSMGLDRRKVEKLNLEDRLEWENKTITSAIKTYLRQLPEPLMSFRYHTAFIAAAKQESRLHRTADVHALVHRLPENHFKMLDIMITHLKNVAAKSDKNLMTVSNLGVCFGPTLLRPEEETMAAIMDIKFCNVVVEIMIENSEKIFKTKPDPSELPIKNPATVNMRPPSPPAYQPPPQVYTGGGGGPTPPSLIHRQPVASYSLIPPIAQAHLSPPPSSPYVDGPSRQMASVGNTGVRNPSQPQQRVAYPSSPTTAELWSGNKLPLSVQAQSQHGAATSSRSNLRPGSAGALSSGPTGRPLGVIPPLSSATSAPERPHSNTSLSSSDSAPGSTVSSSRSSSRDPLPPLSSFPSIGPIPPSVLANPSTVSFNGQPPASKPPYGLNSTQLQLVPASVASIDASDTTKTNANQSRRVRTLYACVGENETELTFEPNQIIVNVRPSREPGWLEGVLNGRTGLIPENYVELLP